MSSVAYRPDIDGLRAVAVSAVVLFHAFPEALPGGFVGVDVFFVISGYLITSIIVKNLGEDRFTVSGFYIARVRRILPALALVLFATLAFGFFALFPDEYAQLGWHAIGAVSFLSNIFLWSEAGYFDAAASTKPLLHLWSLGIEEQFYLVWPVLLMAATRFRWRPIMVIGLIGTASFLLNLWMLPRDPGATFYLPFTRIWELLIGAALAVIPNGPNRKFLRIAPYLGLAMIAIAIGTFTEASPFPGWLALLPTMGTALIIWGNAGLVTRVLSLRAVTAVGKISYPLYLWHWPLLSFATIINGEHPDPQLAGALVLLATALAVATYLWVERPAQVALRKNVNLAAIPAGATVAAAILGASIMWGNGWSNRPPFAQAALAAEQVGGSIWDYNQNDICTSKYRSGWDLFCYQNRPGDPTVMLVGNSYANHLAPGAKAIWPDEVILNIGTCDAAMMGTDNSDCLLQDRLIEDADSLKLVIISSDWSGALFPGYVDKLRQRIEAITSRGVRILVFGPKLDLPFHVRDCFVRPFRTAPAVCEFALSDVEAQITAKADALRDAIAGNALAAYHDPLPLFCSGEKCSVILNDLPLLRDNGHFSVVGSISAMKAIGEEAP